MKKYIQGLPKKFCNSFCTEVKINTECLHFFGVNFECLTCYWSNMEQFWHVCREFVKRWGIIEFFVAEKESVTNICQLS